MLSISSIASFCSKYSLIQVSSGALESNSNIPDCLSSINQSSSSLQIIHSEVSHLIFVFLITKSAANCAPQRATGTFIPAFTFGAPQTIG
ncbi:hypothetical protein HOB94_03960 [bacterium]|nr:hypothetical protein [bacterium]MBT6778653.1 hypothetical protein [bacterium]